MKFEELAGYRPAIERLLAREFRDERRTAVPALREYLDISRDLTLRGGKRFRAILVLAGYHIVTGRRPDPVVPAAAALEHFQSWMLIHDDIIDHGEERRGGPTVHRAAARLHARGGLLGSPEDFGVGMGITLGDLQEPFTMRTLLSVRTTERTRLAALAEYAEMTRRTAYGQLLDIRNESLEPGSVSEKDVLQVHELKSAVYTVVSPLRIGALLGGSAPAHLTELSEIARDLGIAFQLRDDLLGAGLGGENIGKSANDLVEGKRTLLVVWAWSHGTDSDRARLRRVLGNPSATPEDVERAREILRASGSLAYSERRIRSLARRAYGRLDRSHSIRAAAKPLIREIGERLVVRNS